MIETLQGWLVVALLAVLLTFLTAGAIAAAFVVRATIGVFRGVRTCTEALGKVAAQTSAPAPERRRSERRAVAVTEVDNVLAEAMRAALEQGRVRRAS